MVLGCGYLCFGWGTVKATGFCGDLIRLHHGLKSREVTTRAPMGFARSLHCASCLKEVAVIYG